MKVYPLSLEEIAATGFTHRVNITYADLVGTAGLTKTLAIFPESGNSAAGIMVQRAASKVNVAGVGCATLALEVGDGGDVDRILASHNLKATAGTRVVAAPATMPCVYNAADTIDALVTAGTDNLTSLTAGDWDVYLKIVQLDQLA